MKSHLFPAGILAKTISMTHSGMLYRVDIFMFYFYEPFLFKIFVPYNIIKTSSFSCLLSLLQSTVTFTVNVSINIFFCFKYTV